MNQEQSFGRLVRQRRRELDLTQEELARRVGCAAITVRKIEADDARPSVQIAERLAMALAIPLDDRAEFVRRARAGRPAPAETPTPRPAIEEIGLDDLSGRSIRGYALAEKIGAGGMGAVYRAVQPLVEREVAIKIILPAYANHPDFIRRFEAEAQLVARLEHPHIVPLYDYWREPGIAYLVMRLLRGGSLSTLLKDGALPLEMINRLLEQICQALHAAHRIGVIHRDLKPANVLLDEDHNAYLADFGIAKNLGNPNLVDHTNTDVVLGSPVYFSPEQIRSATVRPQTDIYALGVMLYELLTGTLPFTGPTPFDLIQQHMGVPMPPLAARREGLPAALDAVISRASAKEAEDRYPDALALLDDFHRAINGVLAQPVFIPVEEEEEALELVNPYKGLRAFAEADADDYFGRETLIQQLLARLGEGGDLSRFLAVVGPSGSGKSSVVKAGLIPALRRGALVGSESWFVINFIPGAHPFEELEAGLLRVAVNPPTSLLSQLKEDDRGLLRAIRRVLPADEAVELVLVIDQFEEIFTLVTDEAERALFLSSLVTAVMDERSRVRVIITLRADFTDRPLRYVDFGELVQRRSEFVLPLTPDELERAIIGPARRVGLRLESGLVTAIIHDVSDQPGALPLLQYALTELYEKREGRKLTKAAYESIGGVSAALGRRAEEVYRGMSDIEQAAARQIFLRLITLGEGVVDTRRRVLRSEVESMSVQPSAVGLVANVFGQHRLFTFDRDPITRGPTVEVAHEALLREWPRLREWLTESRADMRLQRVLADETAQWNAAQRDASFLLIGTRLAQFENWASNTTLSLTADERAFLTASIAERDRQRAAEADRQQRELEAARQLAETQSARADSEQRRAEEQSRSANRLRTRNRVIAAAGTIALLLAILAGVFGWQSNKNAQQAQSNLQDAQTAQAQAEANFTRAEAQRLAGEANNLLLSGGNVEQIALLSLRSMNLQYTSQGDVVLAKAARLNYPRQIFAGHKGWVAAAFSPDGRYVLTASTDGTARLWDAHSGQPILEMHQQSGETVSVAVSPDSRLALINTTREVTMWNMETRQLQRSFHLGFMTDVAFSADGKQMMIVVDFRVYLLDIQGEQQQAFKTNSEGVELAALSPDGRYLATTAYNGPARLWDIQTGQAVRAFGQESSTYNAAFSPDGKTLLVGSPSTTGHLWNVETGQEVYTLTDHTSTLRAVAFSPDGRYMLTGSDDQTARLWDVQSGKTLKVFNGHTGAIGSVAFSPDGRSFLTGSADGTARLWDLNPPINPPEFIGHSAFVNAVAFSPNGEYVLTSSDDGTARLWNAHTGEIVRVLSHPEFVLDIAFSPDSQSALTTCFDGLARLWNVKTGEEVHRFTPPPKHYSVPDSVAYSPDGKYILVGYADASAIVWEVATGKLVSTWQSHSSVIQAVAISPDGKTALTASRDTSAILWNYPTGIQAHQLTGHTDSIQDAVFSFDGQYVLTGSVDKTARLWDTHTGQEVQRFIGHTLDVNAVDLSPDGQLAATGSSDGTARLWNVQTGQEVRRFDAHALISAVRFSPDGKYLLIGDSSGVVRLWNVDYHETMEYLCSRLLRDFSAAEQKQYGLTGSTTPACPN